MLLTQAGLIYCLFSSAAHTIQYAQLRPTFYHDKHFAWLVQEAVEATPPLLQKRAGGIT